MSEESDALSKQFVREYARVMAKFLKVGLGIPAFAVAGTLLLTWPMFVAVYYFYGGTPVEMITMSTQYHVPDTWQANIKIFGPMIAWWLFGVTALWAALGVIEDAD